MIFEQFVGRRYTILGVFSHRLFARLGNWLGRPLDLLARFWADVLKKLAKFRATDFACLLGSSGSKDA